MSKDTEKKQQNQKKDEAFAADINDSSADDAKEEDYDRDENARGEGPDNLRQRSEWFQKRTGRR